MYADIIKTDYADGQSVGVNSTPTFFFNGVKESRMLSFDEFKAKIDAELAKVQVETSPENSVETQTEDSAEKPAEEQPAQ